MENENSRMPPVTTRFPQVPGSPTWNAEAESAAPSRPPDQVPLTRIRRPVTVQITIVSTNTSKIP